MAGRGRRSRSTGSATWWPSRDLALRTCTDGVAPASLPHLSSPYQRQPQSQRNRSQLQASLFLPSPTPNMARRGLPASSFGMAQASVSFKTCQRRVLPGWRHSQSMGSTSSRSLTTGMAQVAATIPRSMSGMAHHLSLSRPSPQNWLAGGKCSQSMTTSIWPSARVAVSAFSVGQRQPPPLRPASSPLRPIPQCTAALSVGRRAPPPLAPLPQCPALPMA
mmetsp:Transcript_73188/g.169780  ORF Transcript_73188/g.169780 Transcript_73188/m.169780 type:complete len:220 (+) Transcript_73188:600-1259(+)